MGIELQNAVPLIVKDAETVRKAYAKALTKLPRHLARSLTYDQSKEISQYKAFTISTGMKVYFAHPAFPWEQGTNENTNGLIRQYFPKGTAFDEVTPRSIKLAQDRLNGRPRRVLDGVVAALPDGIEMCQVCECKSSQSGKGGNHG